MQPLMAGTNAGAKLISEINLAVPLCVIPIGVPSDTALTVPVGPAVIVAEITLMLVITEVMGGPGGLNTHFRMARIITGKKAEL